MIHSHSGKAKQRTFNNVIIDSSKLGKHFKKIVSNYFPQNVERLLFLIYILRTIAHTTSLLPVSEGIGAPNLKEYDVDIDMETNSNHSGDA